MGFIFWGVGQKPVSFYFFLLKKCLSLPTPIRHIPTTHHLLLTFHANDSQEDDKGDDKVGDVSLWVDVGMSCLVDLQHTQPTDHVHERRIYTKYEFILFNERSFSKNHYTPVS